MNEVANSTRRGRADAIAVALRQGAPGTLDGPALGPALSILAEDIERRPGAIQPFPPSLADRITALTDGIAVDLDERIDGEIDL